MNINFEAWVDRARAVPIENELDRRGFRLRGRNEQDGPCPKCGGADRFGINVAKRLWNCRHCGKGGDVIDLVQHLDGVNFVTACKTLTNEAPPARDTKPNGTGNGRAQPRPEVKAREVIANKCTYHDEDGRPLFGVRRIEYQNVDGSFVMKDGKRKKTFRQGRPGPDGNWIPNVDGVRVVPYRLPELLAANQQGQIIFIVEGEAKVDLLRSWGLAATCNSAGAGKWRAEHSEFLNGADAVILPDNDEPGHAHGDTVGASLQSIASSVRLLELPDLPPKGDILDWAAAGATRRQLDELIAAKASPWCRDKAEAHSEVADKPSGKKPLQAKRTAIEKMTLGFPDMTETGKIRNTCNNARHAITEMGITCEYDKFHDKLIIGGQTIGQYAGELSDHACLYLRKMIEEAYEFDPGREKMFDACVQLCLENSFDPVVRYLDGLKWDGKKRVEDWLTTYLGAASTELNKAIGRITLVAQVRRAKQPGCKFDQIIVMESPEGHLKSTALSILACAPENFSDQTILGKSDKEQQELLRGIWLYEIADLSNIVKSEVEHVKAFASRTHDRARPAYGRARVDLPRRCVIWATTNNSRYLKSQTGNRRFWPFGVGEIKIKELTADRDQLLAEAVVLEKAETSIVLPRELWSVAAVEQEQRRETDPWEDILRNFKGTFTGSEYRALTEDLLTIELSIPKERQVFQHTKRIGDCMRLLGWDGPKQMRINERSGRGYWRADQT